MVSLNDLADRPPRALADGEVIDLGRQACAPHRHAARAARLGGRLLYEETTGTLFCGDLFTHLGNGGADRRHRRPGNGGRGVFHYTSLTPGTPVAMRKLAALGPKRLAVMHGSSYAGNGRAVLDALADYYEGQLRQAMAG